jgi:hypothetical protein
VCYRLGSALAVILVCARSACCAQVVLSPPGTDGWKGLPFRRIARQTAYTVLQDEGRPAVRARSECAASLLYLPLDVDLQRTPRLQWAWKVAEGLSVADERSEHGDDFAARVYVMFRFDSDHASLWERTRHAIATALYGDIVPGSAISYVWSSHEPAGTHWDNPFQAESKMLSLGSGTPLPWTTETVDIVHDYVRLFGREPAPLLALGIMTDSDNSCQQATAYYADFKFLGR